MSGRPRCGTTGTCSCSFNIFEGQNDEPRCKKTVKECQAEWQADKAANQTKGITEKAYVAQCRAGESAAQPAPAPAASTSSKARTTIAPAAPPARSSARPAPAPAATAPNGAYQYATEAQAKARCGSGTVVWANLNSNLSLRGVQGLRQYKIRRIYV
jgi:hypothetical protein